MCKTRVKYALKYAREGNKSEACEMNETKGKKGRGRKQERRMGAE